MSDSGWNEEEEESLMGQFLAKAGAYGELYPTFLAALRAAQRSSRPEVSKRVAALREARARRDDHREHLLKTAYGLTRAESRLTLYLVIGGSVTGYAEISGVAVSTARTHLKAVFAKTGAKRQSQLAELLSGNLGPGEPKIHF